MIVRWDDYGRCMPDTLVFSEAKRCINENGEFHVANRIAIDAMRVALIEMPKHLRPETEWIFFGESYVFDDLYLGNAAFKVWQTQVWEDLLMRHATKIKESHENIS